MEIISDRHHVLERRTDWESNKLSAKLRRTKSLIPEIPRDLHNKLTDDCPIVPLLGMRALQLVDADFRPSNDTLNSIDRLLCSINKASKSEALHWIERDLAELCMHSIEMQLPYLKGNIITHER